MAWYLTGLLAAFSASDLLSSVWNWVLVLVAFGLVIFVHELGHFLVAKACGVKVEKFYIGFDVGGAKLFKFRWGETEYGIGALPLGGYVKMLGQEDNPARIREEIERAQRMKAGEGPPSSPDSTPDSAQQAAPPEQEGGSEQPPLSDEELRHAQAALYDPRSYLAQSVPKRMAIISAGVIMNLVFAFVFAVVAYMIGVTELSVGVGEVLPGQAAWKVGLREGDEILQIAGEKAETWNDLTSQVRLGDLEQGVPILVQRPGEEAPFEVTVTPDRNGSFPTIGIGPPTKLQLNSYMPRGEAPVYPGSAADRSKLDFVAGDRIVAVGGQPIESVIEWDAALAANADRPLEITIERMVASEADADVLTPVRLSGVLPPNPMLHLGLVMGMGEIATVQQGSPADLAGIRPGDAILRIDGEEPGDPMLLPTKLNRRGGETVRLAILRGEKDELEIPVKSREVTWIEFPFMPSAYLTDIPMPLPSLGLTYRVLNRVSTVRPGTPAAAKGLRSGDVIVQAKVIPPEGEETTLAFNDSQRNWPILMATLQLIPPKSKVELTLEGDRTVVLEPAEAALWFNPHRGLIFDVKTVTQTAESPAEAVSLGFDKTVESTLLVYQFLQKLFTQISPRALSGPIGILQAANAAANQGIADLLIFLTLLSANLAVVNFLPIPILDGGHFVFLAYEGIRGKPASEKVQVALTYAGLFVLLTLMVWVFGLDLGIFARK